MELQPGRVRQSARVPLPRSLPGKVKRGLLHDLHSHLTSLFTPISTIASFRGITVHSEQQLPRRMGRARESNR